MGTATMGTASTGTGYPNNGVCSHGRHERASAGRPLPRSRAWRQESQVHGMTSRTTVLWEAGGGPQGTLTVSCMPWTPAEKGPPCPDVSRTWRHPPLSFSALTRTPGMALWPPGLAAWLGPLPHRGWSPWVSADAVWPEAVVGRTCQRPVLKPGGAELAQLPGAQGRGRCAQGTCARALPQRGPCKQPRLQTWAVVPTSQMRPRRPRGQQSPRSSGLMGDWPLNSGSSGCRNVAPTCTWPGDWEARQPSSGDCVAAPLQLIQGLESRCTGWHLAVPGRKAVALALPDSGWWHPDAGGPEKGPGALDSPSPSNGTSLLLDTNCRCPQW